MSLSGSRQSIKIHHTFHTGDKLQSPPGYLKEGVFTFWRLGPERVEEEWKRGRVKEREREWCVCLPPRQAPIARAKMRGFTGRFTSAS